MAAPSSPANPFSGLPPELRFIDIGINLGDPIFRGIYHGKRGHEDDLAGIVQRARDYGLKKLVVTGSDLKESQAAVDLAEEYPNLCYATIGVHPCSAKRFLSDPKLLASLRNLILTSAQKGTCVAIGEIGLDYDRLFLTDKATQLKYFEQQLDLAVSLHGLAQPAPSQASSSPAQPDRLPKPLPLFLHSRAAHTDFLALLRPRLAHLPARGVVHSFTGTLEEMREIVALGLDVGINGCSLKTAENLDVVRAVPLERLQLETDGPWCEVRASSAGMAALRAAAEGGSAGRAQSFTPPRSVKKEKWVEGALVKNRNEPCMIGLVAEIVAVVKGVHVQVVCEAAWRNSCRMFGFDIDDPTN